MRAPETISFSGRKPKFKWFLGDDFGDNHHRAVHPDTHDKHGWYRGSLPGTFQHDLLQNGLIPDPHVGKNSLLSEWASQRTVVYKWPITIKGIDEDNRVQLRFDGVDYDAGFYLNGRHLGNHTGMFTPAKFEIAEDLRKDPKQLIGVVIYPAPMEEPQVGKTSRVRTHKTRMNYGWDFCPRMIQQGIWQDASVKITGPTRIEDVFVRPELSDDLSTAEIAVQTTLSTLKARQAIVETTLSYNGDEVDTHASTYDLEEGESCVKCRLRIPHPHLWWPNGSGDQPLYNARVSVRDATSDTRSDEQTTRFGVRDIRFVQNEGADADSLPYTAVVNGQKTYINGFNWVPMEAMYGADNPEKLHHLLELVKQGNGNLLRVWGGGLIEKEAFYNLCDELGILVWQEFIQSSSSNDNRPSEDPEFIEFMQKEAQDIVRQKRNHPSLAIWGGGNELTKDVNETPADLSVPVLNALNTVVKELDPDKAFLPSSPSGETFINEIEGGDVHGPWEHQGLKKQFWFYNRSESQFNGEFGTEGIAHKRTLEATMNPKDYERISRIKRHNPEWAHRGDWWINEQFVHEAFGNHIRGIDTFIKASQYLQASGIQYAIEANRRRQYQNSGSVIWMFDEPFPNGYGTNLVDYYCRPKPAYYAAQKGYEPIHISAKFPTQSWQNLSDFFAEAWVGNAFAQSLPDANLLQQIVGVSGTVYEEKDQMLRANPNASTNLGAITMPLRDIPEDLFFLRMNLNGNDGATLSQNAYLFTKDKTFAKVLSVPKTKLAIVQGENGVMTITNIGQQTALYLNLQDARDVHAKGYVTLSDNYFPLFPGESREVTATWDDQIPKPERLLEATSFNTLPSLLGAKNK